jgi:chemotaxis protein MotB
VSTPRPQALETDDAGTLMSISDMMAGLLFVFMITLAAFIIRFQDATDQQVAEKNRLTSNRAQRDALLEDLKQRLLDKGITVEIDKDHGVLRLKEDAVKFRTGKARLDEVQLDNVITIGSVLADVLPCYTKLTPVQTSRLKCSGQTAKLDSVFVEGHTDSIPIFNSSFKSNWELSTQRAIETYRTFEDFQPQLIELINPLGEKLFSVSGYGENRPVIAHELPTEEAENRRIDLRFIMAPPSLVAPQEAVTQAGLQ